MKLLFSLLLGGPVLAWWPGRMPATVRKAAACLALLPVVASFLFVAGFLIARPLRRPPRAARPGENRRGRLPAAPARPGAAAGRQVRRDPAALPRLRQVEPDGRRDAGRSAAQPRLAAVTAGRPPRYATCTP